MSYIEEWGRMSCNWAEVILTVNTLIIAQTVKQHNFQNMFYYQMD